jgi:hypothetical protein
MAGDITVKQFWATFGGLILILLISAFSFSQRLAVTEERLHELKDNEEETILLLRKVEEELNQLNGNFREIKTNQQHLLNKMEK